MTEVRLMAQGVLTDVDYIATADQASILGDGTTENPLRTAQAPLKFQVQDVNLPDFLPLGAPAYVLAGVPEVGIAGVSAAVAGTLSPAPFVVGLVVIATHLVTNPATLQTTGLMSLNTGEWDVVTGGSGGLQLGTPYYLSTTTPGQITSTKPTASGTYVVQVGIASSDTDMYLSLPAVPFLNP